MTKTIVQEEKENFKAKSERLKREIQARADKAAKLIISGNQKKLF